MTGSFWVSSLLAVSVLIIPLWIAIKQGVFESPPMTEQELVWRHHTLQIKRWFVSRVDNFIPASWIKDKDYHCDRELYNMAADLRSRVWREGIHPKLRESFNIMLDFCSSYEKEHGIYGSDYQRKLQDSIRKRRLRLEVLEDGWENE